MHADAQQLISLLRKCAGNSLQPDIKDIGGLTSAQGSPNKPSAPISPCPYPSICSDSPACGVASSKCEKGKQSVH